MTSDIIAAIDSEIERLQNARALLAEVEESSLPTVKGKRGRPKGSTNKVEAKTRGKRVMSEEGRARIAAAQKKRHAAAKKATKVAE